MYGPNTQDLEPLILQRKPTKQEAIRKGQGVVEKKHLGGTNKNGMNNGIDMRKIENGEVILPQPTVELGKQIQAARTAKKMTQSDLDKACCFPVNTTRDYENSKSGFIVNQTQLLKMENALGVKLTRPKAKKIEAEQ